MIPDDLLKLHHPGGKFTAPPNVTDAVVPNSPAEPTSDPASPTALAVDEWGLRRGRDLLAESERLRKLDLSEHAAADFHAAAFDSDPRLLDSCADARRHEFLAQLLDTPEYHSQHAVTRLDDTAAGIAAAHFAEQFATLKQDDQTGGSGDGTGREMAALRAVGRALAAAREEVGELKEAAAALGMGPGSPGTNDPKAVAA